MKKLLNEIGKKILDEPLMLILPAGTLLLWAWVVGCSCTFGNFCGT